MEDLNPEIFREYDIRGLADRDLFSEAVYAIGRAYAAKAREELGSDLDVCIGWDARDSSDRIVGALERALTDSGVRVHRIGMVPTPVVYFTALYNEFDGAIQVTASHNPAGYNGLKMMIGKRTLFGDDIQELERLSRSEKWVDGEAAVEEFENGIDQYIDWIAKDIEPGERQIKVAVDAGNGVAGVIAPKLLERIFNVEVVPMYCDPDPTFPNHHPDPTVEQNLKDLQRVVETQDCDLGVAYDGDGDRIGVIDEDSQVIWGDMLMVVLSRAVLEAHPGATIIGEVKCSQRLFEDIRKRGGEPVMGRVGHSLIKKKLQQLDAELAGEMSGHIFFNDRYFGFDDALYTTCRLLELLSRTDESMSQFLADVPEAHATPEIREDCPADEKFEIPPLVAEHFKKDYEVIDIDGARINFDHGWGLVRASNTQSVLVVRAEGRTPDQRDKYLEMLYDAIEAARSKLRGEVDQ